jgi:hypothetical protein
MKQVFSYCTTFLGIMIAQIREYFNHLLGVLAMTFFLAGTRSTTANDLTDRRPLSMDFPTG